MLHETTAMTLSYRTLIYRYLGIQLFGVKDNPMFGKTCDGSTDIRKNGKEHGKQYRKGHEREIYFAQALVVDIEFEIDRDPGQVKRLVGALKIKQNTFLVTDETLKVFF